MMRRNLITQRLYGSHVNDYFTKQMHVFFQCSPRRDFCASSSLGWGGYPYFSLIYPWRILIFAARVTPEGLVSWGSRWGDGPKSVLLRTGHLSCAQLCLCQHKDTTTNRSTMRSILFPVPKPLHIMFALSACYLLKFQVWLLLSTYWDGCILGEGEVILGLPRYNAL